MTSLRGIDGIKQIQSLFSFLFSFRYTYVKVPQVLKKIESTEILRQIKPDTSLGPTWN